MKKFVLAAAIAALSSTGAFAQGTEAAVVGGSTGGTVGAAGGFLGAGVASATVAAIAGGLLLVTLVFVDGSTSTFTTTAP